LIQCEKEELNMTVVKKLLLSVVTVGFLVTPAFADDLKANIEALNAKFVEAVNKGDAAAVAQFYTEDAALLPPDAPRMNGRAYIQAYWQEGINAKMSDFSLTTTDVIAEGNMAVETGEFVISIPDSAGAKQTVGGKYVVVWKNNDGVWLIDRDIWNASPSK
jgi:uncharacterized protein (TIGR02246 family)